MTPPNVTPQQKPVAWGMPDAEGNIVDSITDLERQSDMSKWKDEYPIPLYLSAPPLSPASQTQEPREPEDISDLIDAHPIGRPMSKFHTEKSTPAQTTPLLQEGISMTSPNVETLQATLRAFGAVEALYPAACAASQLRACGVRIVAEPQTIEALQELANAGDTRAEMIYANMSLTSSRQNIADKLNLILAVLHGYPSSIAQKDALQAVHRLLASLPSPNELEKEGESK